jgi:hypothetical protein
MEGLSALGLKSCFAMPGRAAGFVSPSGSWLKAFAEKNATVSGGFATEAVFATEDMLLLFDCGGPGR